MRKPSSASERKPKALLLAPEAPYPARGGGPLRSASVLQYLVGRFSVHAIVFRQPGAPDPAPAIPVGLIDKLDVIELPYRSKHSIARALRNTGRLIRNTPPLMDRFAGFEKQIADLIAGCEYDVAVIEHFWCASYIEQLRARSRHVALDLHNIESQWHCSLAASEGTIRAYALRRFAVASARLERKWLPQFDSLLVTSAQDAQLVRDVVPGANLTIYPNALPELAAPPRRERNEIAFSGNLEYQPNISAIRFFANQVWPSLRRSWPDLKWKIIGKNPESIGSIIRGDPRIEATGYVDNAVAELAAARVAVVPILGGSGTRIKILEAWAAATPVVSTSVGAEGLEGRDQEHFLTADTAEQFTAAVSRLLESPQDSARIGAAGRALYEERYTWPKAWKAIESLFGNLARTSVV